MLLLLDEVEKVQLEVLQVLLQVMDDGKLTGATGKVVDFTNVVLLMTSNLGALDAETLKIGFGDPNKTESSRESSRKILTPEFRNRIDAVVKFNKLDELMLKIVDRLVLETNELLVENESNVVITLQESARQQLADDGYESVWVQDPIEESIPRKIKKSLSKKILFEDLKDVTPNIEYANDE